jgi:redox-sensitive bicupin YhaK (pirin superfamily)
MRDVQAMSAGTGIRHSERNDEDSPSRPFQIWFRLRYQVADRTGGISRFRRADRAGRIVLLASRRNAEGALPIRADAEVSGAMLLADTETTYTFDRRDVGYLIAATGQLEVSGVPVLAREGLVIKNETVIAIKLTRTRRSCWSCRQDRR